MTDLPTTMSQKHSSHHLPPLHGINIPSDPTLVMTTPLTVPLVHVDGAMNAMNAPGTTVTVDMTDGLFAKMVAGGISCMFISTILNPLDVVKIRLQTQNQLLQKTQQQLLSSSSGPGRPGLYENCKYKGTFQGMHVIYQEEGYRRGLMRGFTPSLLREAFYSSIRMGLYDIFKAMLAPANTSKADFSLWQKIAAGMLSGALGSCIATPLDLMKIRFQSYDRSNPNPHSNTFAALRTTFRGGGIRALYKGCGPTVFRASILTSSQLASYDHSKRWLISSNYCDDNAYAHITSSVIAGFVATTATNPFDVIKTRIMTDGTSKSHERKYSGAVDCVVKTLRTEGLRAFAKGWLPNYLRLGPHFIVSFPLAEFIRTSLGADSF